MRVLITGVSGFLGGHLAQALASDGGYELVGTSRSEVAPIPGVQLISGVEVTSDTDWADYLSGVDVVVHCAAQAHFPRPANEADIRDMEETNVHGTRRLAQQAADAGVKRFVFISSIGVLGDRTAAPFDGTQEPNPESIYAHSKCEAEKSLIELCEQRPLEYVILRPPMVYGPGAPGNFARLVRFSSLPLPLGAASGLRSFVSVWNLASLIEQCLSHPKAGNQILLVSDGQDVTTRELLIEIARARGRKCFLPAVPAGWMRLAFAILGKENIWQSLFGTLQIDDSRTRSLLGWAPPMSLEESIRNCFHFTNTVD